MKLPTLILALIASGPAFAQTATDGETIKLNGTSWRLWGIDAPELQQPAKTAGRRGRRPSAQSSA
jgi:endonuclease YncB( thermonuclease family)